MRRPGDRIMEDLCDQREDFGNRGEGGSGSIKFNVSSSH